MSWLKFLADRQILLFRTEKKRMEKQLEILAPAGAFDSLKAAVHAGADAVYMGGSRFGARAYAENPEGERLLEAIDYAHLYGVKLYLTVNTLLKTKELEQELYDYLKPCYEHGLDAVIVQDMGVLKAIQTWFPGLAIHASTQMTLCGTGGARLLQEAGSDRVVLARELSLEEIRKIYQETGIQIECFVHGALCYCYSGQCLFSSVLGGRSGNRGRCAQPCRLPYEVLEEGKVISQKGENTVLSPKDLCALDLIPQMAKAGVYSFKIEGRMKRPEYTAGVVQIYRKYVDQYLNYGEERYQVEEKDRQELLLLFNRDGFSRGYYEKHNGRDLIALHDRQMTDSQKKDYEALIASLRRQYVDGEKKIGITGTLYARAEEPLVLDVRAEGVTLTIEGECPQMAKNRPMEAAQIEKQLNKTGGTPFEWKDLQIQAEGALFIPVQALNSLRREALERLQKKLVDRYVRVGRTEEKPVCSGRSHICKSDRMVLHLSVETEEQLEVVLRECESLKANPDAPLAVIYLDAENMEDELSKWCDKIHAKGLKAYILLPAVFRQETLRRYQEKRVFWRTLQADGYVLKNLEEFDFFRHLVNKSAAGDESGAVSRELILDHNLYTFNRESRQLWREEKIAWQTNPLELNSRELKEISAADSIQIIYGYYPMMTTAGCLHKTLNRCRHQTEQWRLRDRYQKEFRVKNYCLDCYNVIYNSQPLYLLDRMEEVKSLGVGACRIMFTVEGAQEVKDVLTGWMEGRKPLGEFTRGHFKRGVE